MTPGKAFKNTNLTASVVCVYSDLPQTTVIGPKYRALEKSEVRKLQATPGRPPF